MAGTHSAQTISDGIHSPVAYSYANESARTGATGFVSTDLYKFAIQTDNNSLWMLTATTPTWVDISQSIEDTLYTSDGTISAARDVTLGASLSFTPDTDGSYDVDFGPSLSSRLNSFDAYTDNLLTINSGATNDRSYVALYGSLGGVELGYFDSESSLMGFRINLAKDNNFEVINAITNDGIKYATVPSTPADETLVWKSYVDANASTNAGIYAGSGTLSDNTVVTGNSSDDLTFNHYNGTSSTFTLRSNIILEDTDLVLGAYLGDGFGADLSKTEMVFANTGLTIETQTGDTDTLLHSNDWLFYEGSTTGSTNLLTIHGDGSHSSFDPFVTLHEGFATGNGTNAQALIVNYGKGNTVKFNDGTRSVDTFSITSVVNGSETFTHMEHNYQGVQQDFLNIRSFNWYMDTTGSPLWTIYDDDSGTNTLLTFNDSGELFINDSVRLPGNTDSNDRWIIDVASDDDFRLQFYDDSASTTTTQLTLGSSGGNLTVNQNLVMGAGSQIRIPSGLTTADTWRFDGGQSDDVLRIQYDDDDGSTTNLFSITAAGVLSYIADESSGYTDRSVVDKAYVDGEVSGRAPDQEPIMVVGPDSAITATTSEQDITISSVPVDGGINAYSVLLGANTITFDEADGSEIYEVTFSARFDIATGGGDTRSYARIKARLDGVDVANSEMWAYIREFQGGTNGNPSTGMSHTFLCQPADADVLTFRFWGTTDGGTITDFDLSFFSVVIKRLG